MSGKASSLCFVLCFFFAACLECFAQDFGLILNQRALFTGEEKFPDTVEYSGIAAPWFAAPLGNKADLYVSGGFGVQYDGETWKPLPEIYRFEFIYNPFPALRLEAGRVPFGENLSYVAEGLFDGLSLGINIGGGRLSAGFFYTGFLYKKTAFIYLSPQDRADYGDRDVYFASRRFLGGLNWEKTSIFDTPGGLSLSGLCQIDLNGRDLSFHSQYLEAKFTLALGSAFNTVSGAVIELAEETGRNPYAAFALSLEIQWLLPGALSDMLTLTGRFSSGSQNETLGVFIPVTAKAQGRILRPMLSGIAFAEAAYTARFHRSFSADLSGAYFFRTDETTYAAAGMDASSSSPLLGAEIYGGISWAPFSDLLFSLGGGIFLPGTGKSFLDDAAIKYRVELTAGISL